MERDPHRRTWSDVSSEPLLEPPVEREAQPGADVPREQEGRYHQGLMLGRGGLGQVFGVRDQVIGREVALKVLAPPPGKVPWKNLERRFLREARITAQLQHPGIVPVHDIGRRADGTLYYTMKRVRGKTLGAALEGCRTLRERMVLLPDLLQVAHAVAYAHSRSIVHRDLKPDNIMVGEFGETLVLDWGIARTIRSGGAAEVPEPSGGEIPLRAQGVKDTAIGTVMGTPAYMSPEQAAGRVDDVDARSDVWSLGVMLYELLAGRQPFEGTTEQILNDVKLGVRRPLLEACPEAPPDLAAVVERAMAYRRSDRYPSAKVLATELEAYLTGDRVQAYQYGRAELARRFVGQNRAVIAVGAAALLACVGVAVAFGMQLSREREAAVTALAETLRARADAALPADPISATLYAAGSLALAETAEARGVAMHVARRWKPEIRATLSPPGPCEAVAWSPDGALLACASASAVTLFPTAGGAPRSTGGPEEPVEALAVGADGAVAIGTARGRLARWDASGQRSEDVVFRRPVRALGLDEAGGLVVALGAGSDLSGGELVRLDASGAETGRLSWPGEISDLARSGGRWWFVGGDASVGVLDPATFLATVEPGPDGRALVALDALPDGTLAISAADGSTALRAPGGEGGWRLAGGEDGAGRVRFAVGGRLLVDARETGRVRFLDPGAMATLAELPDRVAEVSAVAVSPDGAAAAIGGAGGVLWVWSLDRGAEACSAVGLFGGLPAARELTFTPDGARVVVPTATGLQVFEATTGRPGSAVPVAGARAVLGFGEAGRPVVSTGAGLAEVDLAGGPLVDHPSGPVSSGAVLPGGEALLLDEAGQAVKWSLRERRELGRLKGSWTGVLPGPQGKVVLLSQQSRAASTLDMATLGVTDLTAAPRGAAAWAVSADGLRMTLAGPGHRLTVVDTVGDRLLLDRELDADPVAVALSADGRWVAVSTLRQEVVVMETGQARVLAILQGHRDRVDRLAFDPAGRQLLTASRDGEVRAWDLATLGEPGQALAARAEATLGHRLEAGRIRP